MKRVMFCLILFACLRGLGLSAEQKALKPEEVLKLRNYELSLQNMELQLELIRRDMERVKQEREGYLGELYRTYGVDKGWKIDLQKGIWFLERSPASEGAGAKGVGR